MWKEKLTHHDIKDFVRNHHFLFKKGKIIMSMSCNQCQETAKGVACEITGVCGKNEEVALFQDVLLYATAELCIDIQTIVKHNGVISKQIHDAVIMNLFMTITNANFDPKAFISQIHAIAAINRSHSLK